MLWRIFAAFWPTNAILLAALFRSSGQTIPPSIGAVTALSGVFVGTVWFLIQSRALGHVKRLESTADRIERALLGAHQSAFAISPRVNKTDTEHMAGPAARLIIPVCTIAVALLWLGGLVYFLMNL